MFEQTATVSFELFAEGLALAGAAVSVPARGGAARVYVADYPAASVRVFDHTRESTVYVGTIPVGRSPLGVAADPAGRRVFVACHGSDCVFVINTDDNAVLHRVSVGSGPYHVAVSPDGERLFVSNFNGNTVSVLRVGGDAEPRVERTIELPWRPTGVSVTPDGRRLYVSRYPDHKVKVFDTADCAEVDTSGVRLYPVPLDFSRDGRRAYVADDFGVRRTTDDAAEPPEVRPSDNWPAAPPPCVQTAEAVRCRG